MDFSQIKLLIWDLDETLWKGTLSEGNVVLSDENKQLIYNMVNSGVMVSVCSKNDPKQVEEQLVKEGINELFVFNSVNWSPKGSRVKEIITEMNLREVNVMFIDDNASNRGEVKNSCPAVTVEDVDIIPLLVEYFSEHNNTDLTHERLKRYKLLEKKRDFKAQLGSNIDFLRQSNIKVVVHNDCLEKLDRIHELINRSNQLNFTKVRSTPEELTCLLENPNVKCAYITVTDNFGDYGIVGFYAQQEEKLLHFTFSCRILGMGVEQYIYNLLNKPALDIIGEVSSDLTSVVPDWINKTGDAVKQEKATFNKKKILLKGPCDLEQVFGYIDKGQNIITEFVYVNDKGIRVSQGTHTMHMVQSRSISEADKLRLAKELPFGDIGMYETQLFSPDIDCVVLSLFADPSFGMYKERSTGIVVAYGEYVNDMTDTSMWEQYMNGEVFLSNCKFTKEDLVNFSNKFEFIGRMSPDDVIKNLDYIYENISSLATLILVLGSETDYEKNSQPAYVNRHIYHRQLNEKVRCWQQGKERVELLDVNEFITGQDAFTNNINHFNRSIYYKMSGALVNIIKRTGGETIKQNSLVMLKLSQSLTKIKALSYTVYKHVKKIITHSK